MTVLISNEENIRIISLNRPEKLNAITLEMATELNNVIQDISSSGSVGHLMFNNLFRERNEFDLYFSPMQNKDRYLIKYVLMYLLLLF